MFNPAEYQQQPQWNGNQMFGGNPALGGYYPSTGFNQQPTAPQVVPGATFLSNEQMKELQKQPVELQTKLTRDQFLRSICNHRDNYGQFHVEELPEDHAQAEGFGQHCHCTICGAEWHMVPVDTSDEDIKSIFDRFNDVFQSLKVYITCPPESFKDLYMISGFVEKIYKLWTIGKKNFDKNIGFYNPNNMSNEDKFGFQLLGRIMGQPGMAASIPGFNAYGNPYYAAAQQQNPQMNPAFYGGVPQAPAMGQYNTTPSGIAVPNNQFAATAQPNYNPAAQQQPQQQMYGFGQAGVQNNPVGYVDNTPDFTQQNVVQQPQTATTTQSVAMPGPAVNSAAQQAPEMPAAPKNPNLQVPDQKASVNKNFPA